MRRPDLRTAIRWAGPLLLLALLLLLRVTGDRWWPALPLLYGPRYLFAPLALVPLLATRRGAGRTTAAALLLGATSLLLLLDFRLPWRRLFGAGEAPIAIVPVLTWNAQGGGPDPAATATLLLTVPARIIVISECSSRLGDALAAHVTHAFHRSGDICFLTTYPVREVTSRSQRDFWELGGAGAMGKVVIDIGGTEVVVGGVHLETPRDALEALAKRAVLSFPAAARSNTALRELESSVARSFIAPGEEQRPVIVAGDFNLPVESAIYRRWWGDLTNAFSARGSGLGWTKETARFGVRIDHVLASDHFEVHQATLLPRMSSDHRPLLVELHLVEQ